MFVAILILGEGLNPKQAPLPVVKQMLFAHDATWPVTDTGSYPGLFIKLKPFVFKGSA